MGGKKGKMTDFGSSHEKWKGTQYLRELPASLAYARKNSCDEAALQKKKLSDELLKRKCRNYCFLTTLINDRLTDDVREGAGDKKWIQSLTSGSERVLKFNREKSYNLSKIRAAAAIIDTFARQTDVTNIRSLREACIETIAANLPSYETESLQKAFCSLPPYMTELLSLLSAEYQTIDDTNVECLSNKYATYLILAGSTTDVGISKLVKSSPSSVESAEEDCENWWEMNLDSFDVSLNTFMQKRLVLLGCELSSHGVSLLRQHFRHLELLVVHGSSFNYFGSSARAFHVAFCDLFTGWPNLTELQLSYCPWVCLDSIETLIGHIRCSGNICGSSQECSKFLRSEDDFSPKFVGISKIIVTGISNIETVTAARVTDLVNKFYLYCNITLIITI
jgi:hypothetical protein